MKIYAEDKNKLPTRIPACSSVTMTDKDSLEWNPCLWASMRSCLRIIHVYMHVWVLDDPAVQYDWWLLLLRVLRLNSVAPLLFALCQLVLFSCRRVIPSLLKNPQFLLTFPAGRTPGILDRLKFSQSMCSKAYWFFSLSHFISFISCGFMSNFEPERKKRRSAKPVLFIAWAFIVSVLFSLSCCCCIEMTLGWCFTLQALWNTNFDSNRTQ